MSILPISQESIDAELKGMEEEENVTMNINDKEEDLKEEEEEEEEEELLPKPKKELFEKPKKEPPTGKGRGKRVMTEETLAKLKLAREKSVAKRKEIAEAKALEKQQKLLERRRIKEEKEDKKLEQQDMIELKAHLLNEAQREATWDEDRIAKLMEKTLDNYIDKKTKLKEQETKERAKQQPVPRAFVPANEMPQQPLNPKYYNPTQPQFYRQQPIHQPQPPVDNNNTYHTLFGNYQ
tara:strand:+ start:194 stop:904 length:711 start_codon:yes stop_codon:yes gene_type:complete